MLTLLWIVLSFIFIGFLAYHYASITIWSLALVIGILLITKFTSLSSISLGILWSVVVSILALLNIAVLRRLLISRYVLKKFRRLMPNISRTEQEALDAGTVHWEGELFSGDPDWDVLMKQPPVSLSEEEQAFLDGPVETLCNQIDDWQFTHELTDLPTSVWNFIKKHGFFGMIIPKEYGGLGFSEWGHAAVLIKVYSRSVGVATTISVPNSLGPAELLLSYGTQEQKDHYLPRLAKGDDIPCFALTGPTAGSDAASLPDIGIVCKAKFEGKQTVGIRLNWDKRYITLAPVATVVGLAFRLFDPDHLIGDIEDIGITCALIPSDTKGVVTGRRHFPVNTCFMNGPTQGKDVFIPLDWIIGGVEMAGQGWRMLMECLGAGRAISLPSSAVGGSKACAALTGAYARIRTQFNCPIGQFEGIEEPLARIGALTYINDAAIKMTAAAIDLGEKPSVASAIVKCHTTENARIVANDAMDIHGGKGICLGPNNYLGRGYQAIPIGITVEGANILTRCLIIFGQGAMRCHPHVVDEIEAAKSNDLKKFDIALFSHLGYIFSNQMRSLFLALTGGRFVKTPRSPVKRYFQLITRYSSALAFMSEMAMLALGANLKRREKLTARLGDALSMLYLASAVLKRFHDEGAQKQDLPLVHWACRHLLFRTQEALYGVFRNFPDRFVGMIMQSMVFPLGKHLSEPNDKIGQQVAKLLINPSRTRDRLIAGVHLGEHKNNPIGQLEIALEKIIAAEPHEKQIRLAIKSGKLTSLDPLENIKAAVTAKIISKKEEKILLAAHAARTAVIAVDDFSDDELRRVK